MMSYQDRPLQRMPSANEIVIGVEDERGQQQPVDIDVADEELEKQLPTPIEEPQGEKRRVSITERVLKQRNSEQELKLLEVQGNQRRQVLEGLLNEHAQILQDIQIMQHRNPPPTHVGNNPHNKTPPTLKSSYSPKENNEANKEN